MNKSDLLRICTTIDKLEKIVGEDKGQRGISNIQPSVEGDLCKAIDDIFSHPNPGIIIVTGFYIPSAEYPAAETDGPLGAAMLINALACAKIPALMVTDSMCIDVVKAAIEDDVDSSKLISLTQKDFNNGNEASVWFKLTQSLGKEITHIISIERLGKTATGSYYDMKANCLDEYVVPIDNLIEYAHKSGVCTIGIGDGGNEIGMGCIDKRLMTDNIPNGHVIASIIKTDYLLVCGVSNWGGMAMVASIGVVCPEILECINKILNKNNHHKVLVNMVSNGKAIDGVTKKEEFTVDGMDESVHLEILDNLLEVMND